MFCGHEYTMANITFCLQADPKNADLKAYLAATQQELQAGRYSCPNSLGSEKKANVFMRTREQAL